jgi:hypothetical protein
VAIKKIISIKNIGRFLNYGASGDVELKRVMVGKIRNAGAGHQLFPL